LRELFTDKNFRADQENGSAIYSKALQTSEQRHNTRVKATMENNSTHRKTNWDWVFTLPFILMLIYLLL